LDSEENTLIPFYDIVPRANLLEVGATSYFHKNDGKYSYDIYTLYKQPYIVKFDTVSDSPLGRQYAPITLLSENSTLATEVGRSTGNIPVATYTSGSISYGTVKTANIFSLFAIRCFSGLRLRLYRRESDQALDANRDFNTVPANTAGVLFDGLLTGDDKVFPYLLVQTSNSQLYYTVNNITANDVTTEIELNYFAYEPENLIPIGYLPRHYKFSRDNTTPLKRRNYLGCRQISTTFDGTSPITIGVSSANTVVVNTNTVQTNSVNGGTQLSIPAQTDAIQFGGGGQLSVE
jgi:hypothetical protein